MTKTYSDILKAEWLRLEEEEKKHKKLFDNNFLYAALFDRYRLEQKQIAELAVLSEKERLVAVNALMEKLTPEAKAECRKALNLVRGNRKSIEAAREQANRKVNDLDAEAPSNKALELKSMIALGTYKFARTKDKTQAAILAVNIDSALTKLKADPELMKTADLSPELLEQAEMAASMGKTIEAGQKALERELETSLEETGSSPEERYKNLSDIIRYQAVEPSDILRIRSPEVDKLLEAERQAEKHSHEKKTERHTEIDKTPKTTAPGI